MKQLLLSLAVILTLQAANAQQKEGTVTYERKMNMWRRITDEQMRSMIPEIQTTKYVLSFSDSVSMYKASADEAALDPFAGGPGGGRMNFRFGGDGDLYKNFTTGLSIQANELGGKNFLIVDTIRKAPWKISSETKTILGVTCRKATRKISQPVPPARSFNFNRNTTTATATDTTKKMVEMKEIEVVAWFAENILAPVGPDVYGQLPGVILELNADNSAVVYTAIELKKTVDAKELKEPKKGKKVTKDEYTKLMMQLMQNQGGGGMMMIRRDGGM